MLIDSHTHLFSSKLSTQISQVIERAKKNKVEKFILPNIDINSIEPMLNMCNTYKGICYPTMGLHPCSVGKDVEHHLNIIKKQLEGKNTFYAVGEIGIDLYWDKTFIEEQKWAFKMQVQWAKEMGLPIIIHARESFDEIFEIIDVLNDSSLFGVFHCFTGTLNQAEKIIDYGGFKIGIGGVLTFKKSGLENVVKDIGLQHLILETDSPYLAPSPHRGKTNESSYLIYIAQKLAEIKEVSIAEISEITTKNTLDLFKIA